MSALSLTDAADSFTGRCFIAQIDRQERAPVARDLDALRRRYPDATLQPVQEEPFWKEIDRFYDAAPNLAAATLAWLQGA